ncbi:MAG: GDP-mannose 4,6-dehydratase [Limisphaerales bacterium]|jgi:GDPmannose 4,6-dehydratase|nr:GDP-mannose 4,6-dehydratase [Verrucomicrobiota bacterium]
MALIEGAARPKAFITGVTGQDGSYLAELLLSKGYEVHGIVRRTSLSNRGRIAHLCDRQDCFEKTFFLHHADLEDTTTLRRLLFGIEPQEIYHFAGQTHVGLSFDIPESTCEVVAMGTLRLLEILRDMPQKPKFFHPASSEVFGRPALSPQDESTPFLPVNPYGIAKAFSAQMVRFYREAFNLFASNAIVYNHESPRRGEHFVSLKICRTVAEIKMGLQTHLALGNLDAQRDWGDARDYVRAFWLILQQEEPGDYVISTGKLHSVREMVQEAFGVVGLDWEKYVRQDPRFFRPVEPYSLVGNPARAKKELNWEPEISFSEMIADMVNHELKRLEKASAK